MSRPFPLKWIRQLSGQNFIFPFYHLISDTPSPCVKHLFPVLSENQFRKDLDFLLTHFSPAGFDEVLRFVENGKKQKKPHFFLSFDDGFSECFSIVAPILKEKGVPAAFFINPAFVGNRQLSHRQKVSLLVEKGLRSSSPGLLNKAANLAGIPISEPGDFVRMVKKFTINDSKKIDAIAALFKIDFEQELRKFRPYMNLSEIRQLQLDGFTIGSHSYEHPEFDGLTEQKMKSEIDSSFQFIVANLNSKHRVFSFPFSDLGVPPSFFAYLSNEADVEISFGTSGIKRDEAPHHLQRIPLEIPGFNGAEVIIRSEYFYYLGKALAGKNLVKRK